jgi:lipopolysaccharide transport system permease protein
MNQIRVYSPESIARSGWPIFREMLEEQINNWELTWRLFVRDLSAKYKQSVLGWLWVFITPLITLGAFLLLQSANMFEVGQTTVSYPVFALLGINLWQLFSNGIVIGSGSIVAGGSLIIKINFPKESLVLAAVGQSVFEFIIRLGLVAIVFVGYGVVPSWQTVLLPLVLLPLIAFTLGCSLLLSLLNVVFRDIEKSLGPIITLLLFLTPVMYKTPAEGWLGWINRWSPLVPLINVPRDMVLYGQSPFSLSFVLTSMSAFLFLLVAWWFFHLAEKRIAERV